MSSVWINYGNARCLIHYDEYDNWLCQLQGTKRVILFPHEDRDKLYMLNPVSINVINTIRAYRLSSSFFIEKMPFDIHGDISSIYRTEIERFRNFKMVDVPIIAPKNFKQLDVGTRLYDYSHNYPLTILFVIEGTLHIKFMNRDLKLHVNKGEFAIFPNHFTYPYEISATNLKIIVPE
jgi:hypothetical protein